MPMYRKKSRKHYIFVISAYVTSLSRIHIYKHVELFVIRCVCIGYTTDDEANDQKIRKIQRNLI